MAIENNLVTVSLNANEDLSAAQYRFVSLINNSGEARLRRANNSERVIGVLQNDPAAAGRAGTVAVAGITKVVAGAAITAGAPVVSDGAGRAIATVSTTDFESGIALTTVSNAGEIVSILLTPYGTA